MMIFSKLIRGLFNQNFINKSKSFFGFSIDEPDFELSRISKLGRFNPGQTDLIHNGFRFIDSESFIYQYSEIFKNEFLYFKSNSRSPLIIDCGANIGVSVCYFKKTYPRSKIIAFEPDPKVFSFLRQNTEGLPESEIELYNSAVWIEDTSLSFRPDGADGGRIDKSGDSQVDAINLSSHLSQKIDLLKIDIEGAEKFVLPAIADDLKNVKHLFIELHVEEKDPEMLERTCSLLRNKGFRFKIDTVGKLDFRSFNNRTACSMQLNLFAINENS